MSASTVGQTLGVAVIGCGGIGQTHARAAREIPGARLVGVSSRDEGRARRVAELEGCRFTTDPASLFADPEVALVSIATSSGSHASLALAAMAAGKHVLIEKPLAMTSADGRRVIAAAANRGLTLSVVFQRRFEETFSAIAAAVAAGALGRMLLVEASCPYFRPQSYYDTAAWRGTNADDGGALMNQGIHLVDLMLWLGGRARRVSAQMATQLHQIEAEDLAVAVVNLENGALATLLASTNLAPGFPHALNLYGDQGSHPHRRGRGDSLERRRGRRQRARRAAQAGGAHGRRLVAGGRVLEPAPAPRADGRRAGRDPRGPPARDHRPGRAARGLAGRGGLRVGAAPAGGRPRLVRRLRRDAGALSSARASGFRLRG